MNVKRRTWKIIRAVFVILIVTVIVGRVLLRKQGTGTSFLVMALTKFGQRIEQEMFETHLPVFSFAAKTGYRGKWKVEVETQSAHEIDALIRLEGQDETAQNTPEYIMTDEGEGILKVSEEMESRIAKENGMEQEEQEQPEQIVSFERETVPRREYQWDYYSNPENLIHDFYAIDATTELKNGQLNVDKLLKKDLRLTHDNQTPQILIYHTHSQEGFADSVPGDDSTTILGAGERLSELLRNEYGFQVIHHTGKYDIETRDYAYSYALPELERVLKENPQIEVVIDLHRDAVNDNSEKLVTNIGGRDTAQFMFFNGLSHTKKQGDIEYLDNPYIEDNLAFSFQMQVLCNKYYPGAARKIYLKGYRYNMHLCPRTLLIELGAQTNTNEEINNALNIIAHVLYMELTGNETY